MLRRINPDEFIITVEEEDAIADITGFEVVYIETPL